MNRTLLLKMLVANNIGYKKQKRGGVSVFSQQTLKCLLGLFILGLSFFSGVEKTFAQSSYSLGITDNPKPVVRYGEPNKFVFAFSNYNSTPRTGVYVEAKVPVGWRIDTMYFMTQAHTEENIDFYLGTGSDGTLVTTAVRPEDRVMRVTATSNLGSFFIPIIVEATPLCDAKPNSESITVKAFRQSTELAKNQTYPIMNFADPYLFVRAPLTKAVVLGETSYRTFAVEQSMYQSYVTSLNIQHACDTSSIKVLEVVVVDGYGDNANVVYTPENITIEQDANGYKYLIPSSCLPGGKLAFSQTLYLREKFTFEQCTKGRSDYSVIYGDKKKDEWCDLGENGVMPAYLTIDQPGYAIDFQLIEEKYPMSPTDNGKLVYRIKNNSPNKFAEMNDLKIRIYNTDTARFDYIKAYPSSKQGIREGADFQKDTFGGSLHKWEFETAKNLNKGIGNTDSLYFAVEWNVNFNHITTENNCDTAVLYTENERKVSLHFVNRCNINYIHKASDGSEKSPNQYFPAFSFPKAVIYFDTVNILRGVPVNLVIEEDYVNSFFTQFPEDYSHEVHVTIPSGFSYTGDIKILKPGLDIDPSDLSNYETVSASDITYTPGNSFMVIRNRINMQTAIYKIGMVLDGEQTEVSVLQLKHKFSYGPQEMYYSCYTTDLDFMEVGYGGSGTSCRFGIDYFMAERTTYGFDNNGIRLTNATNLDTLLAGPHDNVKMTGIFRARNLGMNINATGEKDTLWAFVEYKVTDTAVKVFEPFYAKISYSPNDQTEFETFDVTVPIVETTVPSYVKGSSDTLVFAKRAFNVLLSDYIGPNKLIDSLGVGQRIKVEFYTRTTEDLPVPMVDVKSLKFDVLGKFPGRRDEARACSAILSKFKIGNYKLSELKNATIQNSFDANKRATLSLFSYTLSSAHRLQKEKYRKEERPNTKLDSIEIKIESIIHVDSVKLQGLQDNDPKQPTFTVQYNNGYTIIKIKQDYAPEVWNMGEGYKYKFVWQSICWNSDTMKVAFDAIHYPSSEEPVKEHITDAFSLSTNIQDYKYKIYSPAPTIAPISDTLYWDITVQNESPWIDKDSILPHSWIAIETDGKKIVPLELFDVTNNKNWGAPIKYDNDKYWWKIDTLKQEFNKYKIKAIYEECENRVTIAAKFGMNKVAYPINPQDGFSQYSVGMCSYVATEELAYYSPRIDFSAVLYDPAKRDLNFCDTLSYIARYTNASPNILYKLALKVELPTGMSYIPESLMAMRADMGDRDSNNLANYELITKAPTIQYIDGKKYLLIDMSENPNITVDSYESRVLNEKSIVFVRFKLLTECGFVDKKRLDVVFSAKSGCGAPKENITSTRTISLTETIFEPKYEMVEGTLTITNPVRLVTNNYNTDGKIICKGTIKFKSGDRIKSESIAFITLPPNVILQQGKIGTADLTFTTLGTDKLQAKLVNTKDEHKFEIELRLINPVQWECDNYNIVYTIGTTTEVTCNEVTCNIVVEDAERLAVQGFNVQKNLVTINSALAIGKNATSVKEDVDVTLNLKVDKLQSDIIFNLYKDNNLDGIPDELIFPTDYKITSVPIAGKSQTLNLINVPSTALCNLLLVATPAKNPYICYPVAVPLKVGYPAISKAYEVCQGTTIQIGDANYPDGYQYVWDTKYIIGDANVKTPNFLYPAEEIFSAQKTIDVTLEMIRPAGCRATNVIQKVKVNPLPRIKKVGTTELSQSVCKGKAIQNIVLQYEGGATGARQKGLPQGLKNPIIGSGFVTITGTPTEAGIFEYTIITEGGKCGEDSIKGTLVVMDIPKVNTFPADTTLCVGQELILTATVENTNNSPISNYSWESTLKNTQGKTFTINPIEKSHDLLNIKLIVTNACGSFETATKLHVYGSSDNKIDSLEINLCKNNATTITASAIIGATYQWQKNNAGNWVDIAENKGGKTQSLTTENLTTDGISNPTIHTYRRLVTIPGGPNNCKDIPSVNNVDIRVHDITVGTDILNPGQRTVCIGDKITVKGEDSQSGGAYPNAYYIWQKSEYNTVQNNWGSYETIPNEISTNLTNYVVTTHTVFQRVFMTVECATTSSHKDTVYVFNNSVNNKITPKAKTICKNTDIKLVGNAIANTLPNENKAQIVYKWQKSIDNGNTWTDIANTQDSVNYTVLGLSQETYFRREVSVGLCSKNISDTAIIKVFDPEVENVIDSIKPANVVCEGTSVTIYGKNIVGVNAYKWQKSSNGSTAWTDVGATTKDYVAANMTDTTYYRRLVTVDLCQNQPSSSVKIAVNKKTEIQNWAPTYNVCTKTSFITLTPPTLKYEKSYKWRIVNGTGGFSNDFSKQTETSTLSPSYYWSDEDINNGSIRLSLTAYPESPCDSITKTLDIYVTKMPGIDMQLPTEEVYTCIEGYQIQNVTAENYKELEWSTTGTGKFRDGKNGADGSGNKIVNPFYMPSVADTIAKKVTLKLIARSKGAACADSSKTFVLNILPIPTVEDIDQTNKLCHGDTLKLEFNGNADEFKWSIVGYDLGFSKNGSGNINQKVTNKEKKPIEATITVTPKNAGCSGDSKSMVVTVNPQIKLSTIKSDQVCSEDLYTYTANSDIEGTVSFSWKRPTITGLTPTETTGNGKSISEILENTTIVPIDANYIFTMKNNGCEDKDTVVLKIHPKMEIKGLNPETICSGLEFNYTPKVYIAAASNPESDPASKGIIVKWKRKGTAINHPAGLTETEGTVSVIETLINQTTVDQTATYTFTLESGTCSRTFDLVVTVKPNQTLTTYDDTTQTICKNGTINPIRFVSSHPSQVVFTTTPATGIGTIAMNTDIAGNKVTIEGNAEKTFKYEIKTGSEAGCTPITVTGTITVNDFLTVNLTGDITICENKEINTASSSINLNVSDASIPTSSYEWFINDNTLIGTGNFADLNYKVKTGDATLKLKIATATCGIISSNTIPMTVNVRPNITTGLGEAKVCKGGKLNMAKPSITSTPDTIKSGWQVNLGAGFVEFDMANTSLTDAYNGKPIRFYAVNTCDTGFSQPTLISVTGGETLSASKKRTICNGEYFEATYILGGGATNVIVTAWKPSLPAGITTKVENGEFSISGFATAAKGTYVCEFETTGAGGCGIAKQKDTTIIDSLPTVKITLATTTYCAGNKITIADAIAKAFVIDSGSSNKTLQYRWYLADDANGTTNLAAISIASNNPGLDYTTKYNDNGKYLIFEVNNGKCGATKSLGIQLTINTAPLINMDNVPSPVYVCEGTKLTTLVDPTVTLRGGTTITTSKWVWNDDNSDFNSSTVIRYPQDNGRQLKYVAEANNSCGSISSTKMVTVNVNEKPTVTPLNPSSRTYCNGESVSAISLTGNLGTNATYKWFADKSFSATRTVTGSGDEIVAFIAKNTEDAPLIASIKIVAINNTGNCVGDTLFNALKVTVNPTASVTSTLNDIVKFHNETITIPALNSNVAGVTYKWIVEDVQGTGNMGLSSGYGSSIASFTGINASSADRKVKVTVMVKDATGHCADNGKEFYITVKPISDIKMPTDTTLCNTEYVTSGTFKFTSNVAGTTYSWTSDKEIGFGTNGNITSDGKFPAFTAKNIGTDAIVAKVTVTPLNGTPADFTITVLPTIKFEETVGNREYCHGEEETITFKSNVTGTTTPIYDWTISGDNNKVTLATSGTSNTITFKATNTTTKPDTITVKVTPKVAKGDKTCSGEYQEFKVVVKPKLAITSQGNAALFCKGEEININLTGNTVAGGSYRWEIAPTSLANAAIIGLTTGTGNKLYVQQAGNNTNNVLVATVNVYATGNGCETTTAMPYVIKVNPQPLLETLKDTTFCNPAKYNLVLAGNDAVQNGSYHWAVDNNEIGLSTTNNGTKTIKIDYTNTTNHELATKVTVYSQVITDAKTCLSNPEIFTVKINPTPLVNAIDSLILCPGEEINIPLAGNVPNGSYRWEVTGDAIGLKSGKGNIIDLAAVINKGTTVLTAEVKVFATYGNCENTNYERFSITVNPQPKLDRFENISLCYGADLIVPLKGNVENGSYRWEVTTNPFGLSNDQGNTIERIGMFNLTDSVVKATIDVYATFTVENKVCEAGPETFTVTVNPELTVTKPNNVVLCSGESLNVEFEGNKTTAKGGIYRWEVAGEAINLRSNSGNKIVLNNIINNSDTIYTTTVKVFAAYNGCESASEEFTITVNPQPKINKINDITLCNGSKLEIPLVGNVTNGTYRWAVDTNAKHIGLEANSGDSIKLSSALNLTTQPIKVVVNVYAEFENEGKLCTSTPEVFTITVNPTATAKLLQDVAICEGESTNLKVEFTGAAPWSITYTDGTTSLTIPNITQNPYTISVNPKSTTTYTLSEVQFGTCVNYQESKATVTVNPLPEIGTLNISGETLIWKGTSTTLAINSTTDSVVWYSDEAYKNIVSTGNTYTTPTLHDNTINYVKVVSAEGCQSKESQKVEVLIKTDVLVPEAITPNDDNVNDKLIIEGIENFPNNTIHIYSRWGDVVYELSGYNNTDKVWSGESDRKLVVGSGKVPVGTYFYVLELNDDLKTIIKGFVEVRY